MSPRADAARNRERVLAAAETVFASKGVGAATDEIARVAGVGIGTVFRHFPTKEALLSAVLGARLDALADEADRLADSDGPGDALFDFIGRCVEQSRSKNAYAVALAAAGIDARDADEAAKPRVYRAVGALLSRAQQSGAVRADIAVPDLFALLVGASHAAEHANWDPDMVSRMLAVLFDGLRAS
jgi:AcrR family transcriptional regulator